MVKKAVLSLVFLTVLGAAAFADYYNGYQYSITYIGGNTSSTFLSDNIERFQEGPLGSRRTSKLPNSVHQVISHALEDYTLDVGDYFTMMIGRPSDMIYGVHLRITNRNGTYEFIAIQRSAL
ncbi:hypothetical protein AGMMS49579_15010 [Spirochaetia bacterium]|nr:hypothetical protein AGMMS49579_15010 [Spirochaetia bacterium]